MGLDATPKGKPSGERCQGGGGLSRCNFLKLSGATSAGMIASKLFSGSAKAGGLDEIKRAFLSAQKSEAQEQKKEKELKDLSSKTQEIISLAERALAQRLNGVVTFDQKMRLMI